MYPVHKKNRNFNTLISTKKYYPFSLKILDSINTVNSILALSIFSLGIYIISKPILPEVSFFIEDKIFPTKEFNETESLVANVNALAGTSFGNIVGPYTDNNNISPPPSTNNPVPKSFKTGIKMPSIKLNSVIYSSNNSNSLYKGIWHKSNSGNPIKGSNMVITAHRFMYTSNNDSFYHLPKVKIDDTITINWEGKEYKYKVSETKIVTPDQIEIENPTDEHILTLYTCTPLWTSTDRFVVIAKPI